MVGIEVLKKLSGLRVYATRLAGKAGKWWTPVREIINLNLMDGIIVPRKSLAVSVERGFLWVVKGSRFLSRIRIAGFRRYIFDEGKYPSPESFASSLSLAIRELKASRVGITLSIPKDWVIIRNVELPAAVRANITDVMSYELDRLTPLSSENAYYDFKILGEKEGKLSVIVVAARADLIHQYINALRNERIGVEAVTVNLSGLGTLCSYMEPNADFICLQIDPVGYEGALIRDHCVVSAFGGVLPEPDGTQTRGDVITSGVAPIYEHALSQGLNPAVIAYAKDKGDGAADWHFGVAVKMLRAADTRLALPPDQDDISFTAVGAALESLWSGARCFNILTKGRHSKSTVPWTGTFILILCLLATSIPYAVLPLQREQKRLQEIDRQISLRKGDVKKVEDLRKQVEDLSGDVDAVERFKTNRPMALTLLKELTTVIPKTAWLTRGRIAETNVDIEGYANSASEILPKLEQSKYFEKVEFASPTIRDVRMNADRFVIKMELEGVVKEETKKQEEGKKAEGVKRVKDGKK